MLESIKRIIISSVLIFFSNRKAYVLEQQSQQSEIVFTFTYAPIYFKQYNEHK